MTQPTPKHKEEAREIADYACNASPGCGWKSSDTSRPLGRGVEVGCPQCKGAARFIGMRTSQPDRARMLVSDWWHSDIEDEAELPVGSLAQLASRIASALSSRDTQIREVLEGLRFRHGCWCELPPNITSPDHTCECDAARGLWERVQGG